MLPVTYIVHRNSSTDDESDAFLRHFRVLEDQRNRHACYRLRVHNPLPQHATFAVEVSTARSIAACEYQLALSVYTIQSHPCAYLRCPDDAAIRLGVPAQRQA